MRYTDMVQRVKYYSGLPSHESEEILELMVVSLSTRLSDHERQEFAGELPKHLHDLALLVRGTHGDVRKDLVRQFMDLQAVDERRARRQITAGWKALGDTMSGRKLESLRQQLPSQATAALP